MTNRVLSDGASNTVNYNIYADSSHTELLGTGMTGGNSWAGYYGGRTGTGTSETINVYGLIDAGQATAVPGSYSDTVLITVTY